MKPILSRTLMLGATILASMTGQSQAAFDLNAWKAQYGTALSPSAFYSTRPGPWGDYFSSTSVDCANATFLYLGPLGVKARPFDQDLSTAAFAALYPPVLVDASGLIQNAFGVLDTPAGGPADGQLYPGDIILEMEDQRIKTASAVTFPFAVQSKNSRGLEIHAGQLVDAAEGRGAIRMKLVRAALTAHNSGLLTAPATTAEVTVNVTGVDFARLTTQSSNNCLANWINPRLENGSGGVLYLNAQTIVQKCGFASPQMGKDATGATVFDGATTITNCIGTRGNSMIEYAVPAGYTTLKFKIQASGTGSFNATIRTRKATLATTPATPRQFDAAGAPVLPPELAPYLETIEFAIPEIGSFGDSYNPASAKVTNYAAILAHRLATTQNTDGSWPSGGGDYANAHFRTALAGLGLMATGDPAYTTHIQKAATFVAANDPGGWAYPRGIRLMFLAEYYLRTRDNSILPGLQQAVNHAQEMITGDFTCGHGLNMGYGGAGYIGATGTVGTGLAIASKCPVIVDLRKLDGLLERVQELAGGNGGQLPYSRGGIGRNPFPVTPSAGQSYSCGAGGVLATKIRGGPQYITELFRKKFGESTTYGDVDGGHASEALTFIMGSLACGIWGNEAHQANMNRFLWRLTLKRDFSGWINLNTNRLEFHGADGGVHGGPTYDTGGYLILLNNHKRNLAITGLPTAQAQVFPATPPTYDVDRKLYWRVLADWNMVDAALGSKMPASLQPKLAELRAMPLGTDLADRTLAFLQREALAAATLVHNLPGIPSPERQHYCEMLLGIGHDITVASIDNPVPATGLSNYRFSVNGYNATSTWDAWGGPTPSTDPASNTRMTGSVTLTDPSGIYLSTPRVLAFTPTSLNPTTTFQVPVNQQVNMTATFSYTVGGSLSISYTRDIIINPTVPFNVDSRAGDYTNVRKVWIPGNCPIPFEKWNMPIQLPSGQTLPGASKNEGTIGFHTYDNGTLVPADNAYKARIRGNPAGYWVTSADRWGECAALGVNVLQGPVLTTTAVTAIQPSSASSGATITADNGWPITRRGICWSTSPYPTIYDPKTVSGTGTGSFSAALTNLEPGVVYHVRAYATNAIGTSYGENLAFNTSGAGGTWTQNGGGAWETPSNWLGGIEASGADAIADFGTVTPAADATVTLASPRSIGGMVFGNPSFTGNWIISGSPLSLDIGISGNPTITVNGGTAVIQSILEGTDGLVKAGTGTLVLNGSQLYTGTTSVNAGTLRLSGSLTSGSPVSIGVAGSLTGTGSIAADASVAGTLSPGVAGVGSLTAQAVLSLSGSTLMDIHKSTATCDSITGMDLLNYGGALTVTNLGGTLAAGDSFTLFSSAAYAGSFSSIQLPPLTAGLKWDTSRLSVDGVIRVGTDALIASQPVDQSVGQGVQATFSITTGGVPVPGCQWQISSNGGSTWSDLPGATGTTYTTAAATPAIHNTRYRCVVSNPLASVTSTAAILTVTSNSLPSFTSHPADAVLTASGQTATFSAAATGTPAPTYQWQVSPSAGSAWTNISGATAASYSFTAVTGDNNKSYRCVATNSQGSAISEPALLLIASVPTWTNAMGGSWPVASNWSSNTVATGTGTTADFSRLDLAANRTVTLDGNRTIGNLRFGDYLATYGWTLAPGSSGTLTLATSSGTPTITVNNSSATIQTVLAGTGGLSKAGAGNLVLAAANTYTGGTSLTAGQLTVNHASALGGGNLTITGGALGNSSGTTIAIGGNQSWNGNFSFNGPQNLTLNGTATLNANRTLTVAAGTLTTKGAISGAFGLTKAGTGTLVLGATNTFTGGLTVNAGTVVLQPTDYTNTFPTNAPVTINNGGTVVHAGINVTNNGTAFTINSGGTLQFTSYHAHLAAVTLNGGSIVGTGSGKYASEDLALDGNLTVGGSTPSFITIANGIGIANRTFNVANATGDAAPDLILSGTGALRGTGQLTKTGAGTFSIANQNSHTGGTVVSAGTLLLNDGSLGTGAVSVSSGATLSGSGSIAGSATIAGNLSPGSGTAVGNLAFATNLTLSGTTTLKLSKSGGSITKDTLGIGGTLTCGGTLNVTATGDALATGDSIQLFTAGSFAGTFATVNLPALSGGLVWDTSRLYIDGSISLGKIPQSIDFPAVSAMTVGDVIALDAQATSGLGVTFTSSNPAVGLLQFGNLLTAFGSGTTVITSSQPGNTFYQAAPDVSRTLTVSPSLPAVATEPVIPVTTTTASSGGSNLWDGGDPITERGVCWSTSPNPTVSNNRTIDGTGSADFTSTLTGLTGTSTYYIRAYVKNSAGYAYGNTLTYNSPLDGVWIQNASGNWSVATNWSGNLIPQGYGSSASFSTLNITADRTVTLDTDVTLGSLSFRDSTASHNWILAPGTGSLALAALSGTPSIVVTNQTATLNTPLSGTTGFTKTGSGTLALGAYNPVSGPISIQAGIVRQTTNNTFSPDSTLTLANATLEVRYGSYNINWVDVNSLTLGGGATLRAASQYQVDNGDIGFKDNIAVIGTNTVYATGGSYGKHNWLSGGMTGPGTAVVNLTNGAGYGAYADRRAIILESLFGDWTGYQGTIRAVNDVTIKGTVDLRNAKVVVDGSIGLYANGASAEMGELTGAGTLEANGKTSGLWRVGHLGTSTTFSGIINGASQLIKVGSGSLTLSNANLHSGGTTVNAGTLLASNTTGSATGSGPVTVAAGATLGGSGTINGPTTINGTVAPGSPGIGTMTINNTLALAGQTSMELQKSGSTLTHDRIQGLSSLTLGGSLTVTATGTPLAAGDSFTLFSATAISGSFTSVTLPTLDPGLAWDTSQLGTNGSISILSLGIPQTITFTAPGSRSFGDAPFALTASATSGLAVTFNSSNPSVATVNGSTVTITGVGTSVITASQAGNAGYAPAPDVQHTLTVTAAPPVVTTSPAGSITSGSASTGGTVVSDGGATITARGICRSLTANPTLADTFTSEAPGTGAFSSTLTGLPPGTTIHVRAYATNSAGTSYGANLTFTTLLDDQFTWTQASGGSWTVASNWRLNSIGAGASKTIHFDALDLASDLAISLDASQTLGHLVFSDATPSHGWAITPVAGSTLTLQASTTPSITVSNQSASIASPVAGGSGLLKQGPGSLVLTAPNTYTGNTTIQQGVLELGSAARLYNGAYNNTDTITILNNGIWRMPDFSYAATGQLADYRERRVIDGGTIEVTGASHSSGQNFTTTANGGTFRYTQSAGTLTLSGNTNGNIRTDGPLAFDTAGQITVTEILEGPGSLIKQDSGTLLLNQNGNSFSGNLTVQSGTLQTGSSAGGGTNGHLGLVSGTRSVTVNTATLRFTGNNVFGGAGKSAATIPSLLMDGGTLSSTRFNIIGNLTLRGGILEQTTTDSGSYEGYQFLGNITVDGNSPSTIRSSNGRANHLLNGTTTFQVADATSNNSTDLLVSNPLRNSSGDYGLTTGSLEKSGPGTMDLAAACTYTGSTTVTAGTLVVSGSLGASPTTVASGATLAGNGSIAGTVLNLGNIAPASSSAGTLTINNTLTLGPDSSIDWQITDWNAAPGTGHDRIIATSALITATSTDPVVIRIAGTPAGFSESSRSFTLIQTSAGTTGFDPSRFTIDTSGVLAGSGSWSIALAANQVNLVYTRSNQSPAFAADPILASTTQNAAFSGQLTAIDPDANELLTFSKISGPAWLSVSPSGALSGSPANSDVGTQTFSVRVTDSFNAVANASLQITVANLNDAPSFSSPSINAPDAVGNTPYSGTVASSATDPDLIHGDSLTYTKTSGPSWLAIAPDGSLSGTPPPADTGTNLFTLRATDSGGLHAETTLTIQVNPGNPDANGNAINDAWETTMFGNAAPGANPPDADADGDGLCNLLEFALDTHPLQPNPSPLTHSIVDTPTGPRLRLSVPRNPLSSNLQFIVEVSGDMNATAWASDTAVDTLVVTDTPTLLVVQDRGNAVAGASRFIRLKLRSID